MAALLIVMENFIIKLQHNVYQVAKAMKNHLNLRQAINVFIIANIMILLI